MQHKRFAIRDGEARMSPLHTNLTASTKISRHCRLYADEGLPYCTTTISTCLLTAELYEQPAPLYLSCCITDKSEWYSKTDSSSSRESITETVLVEITDSVYGSQPLSLLSVSLASEIRGRQLLAEITRDVVEFLLPAVENFLWPSNPFLLCWAPERSRHRWWQF